MNTRERLKNYGRLLAEKNEMEIQLVEIEGTELQAVNYDSIGKSYGTSNKTQNQALNLIELKEKYIRKINQHQNEIRRIDNAMSILNDKEKEFIKLKYIEGRSWEFVSYKIDRGITSCQRINGEALKKIEQILNFKL